MALLAIIFTKLTEIGGRNYSQLLCKVGPMITKQFVVRVPIPAAAWLAMTVRYVLIKKILFNFITLNEWLCRYLATGDCITSTKYLYLVGTTTAGKIKTETCKVLWTVLVNEVMPGKLYKEDWLRIAEQFESEWNFPHCIGAIDGKHVAMQIDIKLQIGFKLFIIERANELLFFIL